MPVIDLPPAASLLEQAEHSCAQATLTTEVFEKDYYIAGHWLRFRFAGRTLADALTAALAHHQFQVEPPFRPGARKSAARSSFPVPNDEGRDIEEPDLTVEVFVGRTVPVALADGQWLEAARLWKCSGESLHDVYIHYDMDLSARLTLLFYRQRRGFICFRDLDHLHSGEVAGPLRELFNAWFQRQDGQLVHGAAIAKGNRAVLIAGASGAGKSNTALACLRQSQMSYLGDDLCLIQWRDARAWVHCLYSSAKLWPHDLASHPHLSRAMGPRQFQGADKPVFHLFPAFDVQLGPSVPLIAILLPRRARGAATGIRPARQADAWRALVPSTLTFIPGNDTDALNRFADLVKQTPAFWLNLGDDRDEVADVVDRFLSKAPGEEGA